MLFSWFLVTFEVIVCSSNILKRNTKTNVPNIIQRKINMCQRAQWLGLAPPKNSIYIELIETVSQSFEIYFYIYE